MTVTLRNNRSLNLDDIQGVQVRKSLAFSRNGRLFVWGWNVIALMKDDDKRTIASYGPEQQRQAIAFCTMINHMTIFSNSN